MIQTELLTDAELRMLLARADLAMRQAAQWGPKMAQAERDYKLFSTELEKRQKDASTHLPK